MAKLVLQFEDRVLRECSVGLLATIGRMPDNTVVIENPAVSSHHACVFRSGDDFIVEDLESTNGTFVNEKRVTRRTLQSGDVVLIGKHKVMFDRDAEGPAETHEHKPLMSRLGNTVFLDTEQHKAMLAKLNDGQREKSRAAVLRVLDGAGQSEYHLEAHTSFIGKADTSLVRLNGWFKPDVAVAITRNSQGYAATRLGGRTAINGRQLRGRQGLNDGDVLRVSGLTLEFCVTG